MTDLEFLDAAEAVLRSIELNCDELNETSDVDIDNQRVGGMITLTFEDRSQIVINLQKPLHEIWMASREGGYHYRCVAGQWKDTKSDQDFYTDLNHALSLHAQEPVTFTPR
ncbi:MAG: hypothetical protein RL357_1887 [Pseudomonadota bacterium]|jgi:CyaY protein